MSETEISQTPEGRPREAPGGTSPPGYGAPGAPATQAQDRGHPPGPGRRRHRPRPRHPWCRSVRQAPAAAPAPPAPKAPAVARARAGRRAPPLPRSRPSEATARRRRQAGAQPAPSRPGTPFQAGGPVPGLRARAAAHDPDRHARGSDPGGALRVPGGRRHQPDRRQRLPGPGPERPARHGGRLRRHRHPQERRAVPGRRALRPGRHRGRRVVAAAPDRGRAQGGADHPVPGHEEPDRGQGRPPDPGGLAARPVRGPRPQLQRVRDLQAPGRHRAPPAAPHHRRGEAGRATA